MNTTPLTNPFTKKSKYVDFEKTGPKGIDQALFLLEQARGIARPEKKYLKSRGLDPETFNKTREIISETHNKEDKKFDFNEAYNQKAFSNQMKALSAGLMGGAGLGASQFGRFGAAAGGAGGLALALWLANQHNKGVRKDIHNTARILREYGLNTPEKLEKAEPLLKSSSSGKDFQTELNESVVPSDVVFYSDGDEKARLKSSLYTEDPLV